MTEVGGATPTRWQTATVLGIHDETSRAKTFRLRLEAPVEHRAGQHFVVRLTAPDGYTASRSYSIASAPDGSSVVDLTVERLDDGEVSGFLHDVVEPGDELEVRGPIGGWFVWGGTTPALLVGGGSGIAPLVSMLRLARRSGRNDLVRLVASVRSPDDLFFAAELPGPETTIVYTRRSPAGETRPPGRLPVADLPAWSGVAPTAYICGSAAFAGAATEVVLASGIPATDIRVERFGPTG